MKQLIHIFSLVMFFLLWRTSGTAQTTNTGMLYISPGTEFSTAEKLNNKPTGEFYNDGEAFIYADFHNDGIIDFYQNTGLTRFIGIQPQEISGSQESYLYNVYFDNTSTPTPFHLIGTLNINGLADFYEGIVDNDNYGGKITFIDNASHVNTSDISHVDGPVNKLGDTEFMYPIGYGSFYRFAGISSPANNNANFEGKYYYENSNALYTHDNKEGVITEIDNKEYWTIKNVSETSDNVLVTLSWRDVTTPQSIINASEQEQISIMRWDEQQNMWVNEGGAVDVENKTVTTAVNNYGVFTLGRINKEDVLPCNIVVYNAVTPNGDGVNDYFMINQNNNECAESIHVQVFNRWGVKVFETNNYGESGNVFDGYSRGRLTIEGHKQLPTGTYFYILSYNYQIGGASRQYKKAGYLYLNGN